MKRMIIIILTVFLISALFSCGKTVSGGETSGAKTGGSENQGGFRSLNSGIVPGDYLFGKGPVKYNIHTGEMTNLCPDPFCTHEDESCQFYRVGPDAFATIGNTVYYRKYYETDGNASLYSFDPDTAETKLIYSESNVVFSKVSSYYYKLLIYRLSGSYRGAKGSYFWYDTKTGETKELSDQYVLKNYILYDIIDDRMIWNLFTTQEYYSTDLNGEDLKEYDFGYRYGNYYEVEEVITDDGRMYYNYYVTPNGETERKLLVENVYYIHYCENKIIYTKSLPFNEWRVFRYCNGAYSQYDQSCGNVYVINPDGTDDHLLFHTDECIADILDPDHNHSMMCGDYYGINLWTFKDDTQKNDSYLIVNLNTGEYVISGPDR